MDSHPSSYLRLIYFGTEIGQAQIDSHFAGELSRFTWGVEFPDQLRRAHVGRPDVLMALVLEDPKLLDRCHPFTQTHGMVLRLSKLCLRPQAVSLMPDLFVPQLKESARTTIRSILSQVPNVSFVNRSRVDCRSSNLREVSPPEVVDDLGDTHPPEPPLDLTHLERFL